MNEQEALERAKALGLRIYERRRDEDVILARWWEYLIQINDLTKITCRSARPLSGFFGMFKTPNFLLYSLTDAQEVEFAAWFCKAEIADRGYYYSNWAHPSIRGTRRQVSLTATIYEGAWCFADVLVGITKQKNLLPVHQKLGYTYGCAIPHFFDSEPAYIVYLTERNYRASRFYRVAQKEDAHGRRRRKERKRNEITEPGDTTRSMGLATQHGGAI